MCNNEHAQSTQQTWFEWKTQTHSRVPKVFEANRVLLLDLDPHSQLLTATCHLNTVSSTTSTKSACLPYVTLAKRT